MECQYCKKMFSTKSILKTHQNTAKFCLKLQGNLPDTLNMYVCTYCNESKTTKHSLGIHMNTCSANSEKVRNLIASYMTKIENLTIKNESLSSDNIKLISQLSDKDELITELKLEAVRAELKVYKQLSESATNCVEEIAKQPKIQTQTTQNIQNNKLLNMKPFDLEDEKVKERMLGIATEFFDRNYFNEGQKGVARFTAEKLLRDTDGKLQYRCTDPSRQTFKFLTNNGDIRTDVRATLLSKLLDETVVKAFKAMVKSITPSLTSDEFLIFSENFMQINGLSSDNSDFRSELAALTANN